MNFELFILPSKLVIISSKVYLNAIFCYVLLYITYSVLKNFIKNKYQIQVSLIFSLVSAVLILFQLISSAETLSAIASC